MITRYDQGMNTHHEPTAHTEPNMQIIENASSKDVRSGDHLTWKWVQEIDGVTVKSSHEGIAHHQDEYGIWWTEGGMWLTSGDAGTLTIRRHAQDLPTNPGAVIIPADGHEYIEATMRGETVRAREATRSGSGGWYAAWRSGEQTSGLASSREITPGTWKVGNR